MKKKSRIRIAGVVGLIAALGIGSVAAASLGGVTDRVVAKTGLQTESKASGRLDRVSPAKTALGRGCTLSCVKRKLRNLAADHNELVRAYNQLAFDFYECEVLADVTSYEGYVYTDGVSEYITTALDYTVPGDLVHDQMVVWAC